MATLKYLPQYFSTTLNVGGGIDDTQTTGIVLQSVSGVTITKPGQICVSYSDPLDTGVAEWIDYTSINGSNELVGVTRGREGYAAKTHLQNATVAFVMSASHHNDVVDLLNGTEAGIKVKTAIYDANGNEVIKTPATTDAVNEVTVTNSATGNAVQISATGGDDNIGLTVASKGTGVIKLKSGSSTTNGHTVPNIADDTVALLAASQTLSNKGISSFIAPNTVASGGTVTTNSTTELTCIETTITNPPIAGQIFIVANFGMNSASVAGDYFIYKVYFGTTPTLITTNTQTVYTTSGGGRHVVTMSAVAAVAASGTQKIKMTVTRGGGTGTIASQSGETYVSWIIVPGAGTTA